MQRLSNIILFTLTLLLLMTGCASVNEQALSEPSEGAGAPIPPLDAPTEDFTLVGITGRPQLLNSYADW